MLPPIRFSVSLSLGLLVGFLFGQIWDLPYRYALSHFFQVEYGTHVSRCDNAMREHFLAKSRLVMDPKDQTISSIQSAELGLLDCHFYDKFRKKLLRLGLTENDLSAMGLNAIEETRADLSVLVGQHEIRY